MGEATRELEIERQGGVEVWTLNRPSRRNALSVALLQQLSEAVGSAARDPELRSVVVTGAGAGFCAGADLKERRGMDESRVRALLDETGRVFDALDALRVPVVAAVHGAALGGGLELALCCDLRVAEPGAVLGLPETRLGIIPGAGGTQRLPRAIGLSWAKQMVLLGEPWSAERALEVGLVHELAGGPGQALEVALQWARAFEQGAPIALSAALEAMDTGYGLPLERGLEVERRCYELTLASDDRREALRAFAERRPPVFKGR